VNLKAQLLVKVFTQERPWSGKIFLCLVCLYLVSILLIALPDGMSTLLARDGLPNPDCTQTTAQENVSKNCNPTLWLTARSTAKEYLDFFGYEDPASYVRGGLLLSGNDGPGLSEATSRMVNLSILNRLRLMNLIGYGLWPPGMFFLNALPLKLSVDVSLGLYQVLVSSSLWAVAFAMIASLLAIRMRLWLAVTLPFMMMSLPLFHDYFFRYGVGYSETYGAALMIIGLSLLFRALYSKSKEDYVLTLLAGFSFAAACLIRSQVYPVAIAASVVLILSFLMRKINWTTRIHSEKYNPIKLAALCAFLLGLYLPLGSYIHFNNGYLFRADFNWTYPFIIPPYPEAGVANFVALGGTRAACEVDLRNCEELRKKIKANVIIEGDTKLEIIKAFLRHPISFSAYKLPIAWKFWMEGYDPSNPQATVYRADNIFILILFAACLVYMVAQRLWLLFWISASTCATLFAPPFLLHFEYRYFYLMKTFFLFTPLWLILICNANIKNLMQSLSRGDASNIRGG